MPQNIIAKQMVESCSMGESKCVIFIAWITATNVAQDDVSHFTIYINGTSYYVSKFNKTASIDQNLILIAFPVCTCAEHQVSVSAVDRCGHESQRSPNVIAEPNPFSNTTACEVTPSRNPGNYFHIIIILYM
ncbi:MAG: hypothetical protein MJE68_24960 [Proteobacteria bacterium]|nr:hypothetical protein [Pseudomonadota bacterium]